MKKSHTMLLGDLEKLFLPSSPSATDKADGSPVVDTSETATPSDDDED
jgi:hypothetical protein